MVICSGSTYMRLIIKLIGIIPIVILFIFCVKEYIEARKKKDENALKNAHKSINIKVAIMIFIIFIPTILLIISKMTNRPIIYDCLFGKQEVTNIEIVD